MANWNSFPNYNWNGSYQMLQWTDWESNSLPNWEILI